MNYSAVRQSPLPSLNSATLRIKTSTSISAIDWTRVRTYLYNAAVAVGVATLSRST